MICATHTLNERTSFYFKAIEDKLFLLSFDLVFMFITTCQYASLSMYVCNKIVGGHGKLNQKIGNVKNGLGN